MEQKSKELLELAAKAAGIKVHPWHEKYGLLLSDFDFEPWNPLEDDADAIRLAVKLRLGLVHDWRLVEGKPLATVWIKHDGECLAEEDEGDDIYAATRRAIVRAAAEIGKGMK